MMATVKTQNQTRFRGRTPSAWNQRMAENRAVSGFLRHSVSRTDGIQDNRKIDPCMGSAHFGIYAFEVLEKIYTEYGYTEREAAASIVQNNLFGLDIDERAAQLANFAIMMKGMQYDKRFLNRGIQPYFYEIKESNHIDSHTVDYFAKGNAGLKHDIQSIINDLKDAKEYGSIIQIAPVDFDALLSRFDEIENDIDLRKDAAIKTLLPLVQEAKILSGKYAVVATNPPYLNKFDAKLKKYIVDNYADYKGDLFSVFIYRNFGFCERNGYSGFMTPMVWMFIKTYEPLRNYVLKNKAITTLIQFEYSAFEEATVPICSFVLKNGKAESKGEYFRLSDFTGGMEIQRRKIKKALANSDCGFFYESFQDNFSKIPDAPIAYWIGERMLACYNSKKIYDIARPCKGIDTGNNDAFLRYWTETVINKLFLPTGQEVKDSDFNEKKWFPYNNGGDYRKWYGNNVYVLDWSNRGKKLQNFKKSNLRNKDVYFKEGITWSTVTSGNSSFRYFQPGFLFDNGGSCLFTNNDLRYIQGFLNSAVCRAFLTMQPTLNTQPGTIGSLPIKDSLVSRFFRKFNFNHRILGS